MSINRHFPEGIPKAIGPYSPSTSMQLRCDSDINNKISQEDANKLIYISGQIPINPQTNEIDSKDIEGQTHQVMKNLCRVLEGSGSSFSSVLKTTILLTDMSYFSKVNQVYESYFSDQQFPARICFAVKQLPKASLIQIDAVAIPLNTIQGELPQKKPKLHKQ